MGAAASLDPRNPSESVLSVLGRPMKASKKADTIVGFWNDNHITELDCRFSHIGDNGAAVIAAALPRCTTLTVVNVHDNDIGPMGGAAIARSLRSNTSVTRVHMSENTLGDETAQEMAATLRDNRTLKELYMADSFIESDGLEALADALKGNTVVTEIDLDGCSGNSAAEGLIKQYLNRNKELAEQARKDSAAAAREAKKAAQLASEPQSVRDARAERERQHGLLKLVEGVSAVDSTSGADSESISVTVSWTTPTMPPGCELTVRKCIVAPLHLSVVDGTSVVSPAAEARPQTIAAEPGTLQTATFDGLKLDMEYVFTVTCELSDGFQGPASSHSNAVVVDSPFGTWARGVSETFRRQVLWHIITLACSTRFGGHHRMSVHEFAAAVTRADIDAFNLPRLQTNELWTQLEAIKSTSRAVPTSSTSDGVGSASASASASESVAGGSAGSADPPTIPAGEVSPADAGLVAKLGEMKLSHKLKALQEYGVVDTEDLRLLEESDLVNVGFSPLECRKFYNHFPKPDTE